MSETNQLEEMNTLRRAASRIPSSTSHLKPNPSPPPLPPPSSYSTFPEKEVTHHRKWGRRPKEIPFQVKVANFVRLIGCLSDPPKPSPSPRDGKFQAAAAISVDEDLSQSSGGAPPPPPVRIPLLFEGDLAHAATHHLKENDHIHIAGELSPYLPLTDAIAGESELPELQVLVHSFNLIRPLGRKCVDY